MKITKKTISTLLIITMLMSILFIVNIPASAVSNSENEYLVLTEDNEALQTAQELSSDLEEVIETQDDKQVTKMTLSNSDVEELKNIDGVVAVEKDVTLKGSSVENSNYEDEVIDALFNDIDTEEINQWNLDAMNITHEQTGDKIKLELLDSGVNYSKDIDVKERINLVEEDNGVNPLYEDYNGHGTSMAGVICAKDNGIDITGINPNISLYSVKALDSNIEAPLSRIVEGIYWGIENDMDIINMSFGTSVNSAILRDAVKAADDAGIIMISSSGNKSETGVQYPAAYPEVLAVGSINADGEISDFTATGEELDLVAPGEEIESTGIFGTVIGTDGTSISSAQVSAVASLILQKDKTKSPDFVKKLLIASSKRVNKNGVTTGVVDCNYAMEMYDEFASAYSPTEDTPEYVNSEPVETYDTDGYVKGLWYSDQHAEMTNQIATDESFSGNALKLIVAGAKAADKTVDGYDFSEVIAYHGGGNYVYNARCLWQFIRYMNYYANLNENNSSNNYKISDAYNSTLNYAKKFPQYYASSDTSVIDTLLVSVRNLNNVNFTDFMPGVVDSRSLRDCRLKAIGLCMHMIGDTFAHRTQVPTAYSKDKFTTTYFNSTPTYVPNTIERKQNCLNSAQDAGFLKEYPGMRKLEVLNYATSCGVVEFWDIKRYSFLYYDGRDSSPLFSQFEENVNFYSRRYESAYDACESLFINRNSGEFDVCYLIPLVNENGTSVKLWNFKNFVKNAGYDTTVLTQSEWNICTSYKKKVDSNGNIVLA